LGFGNRDADIIEALGREVKVLREIADKAGAVVEAEIVPSSSWCSPEDHEAQNTALIELADALGKL
jgi:hypothetical protein